MARIRSIRPEFAQSESMGSVSRDARLLFILLWTLADDEGRLRGNVRMLASMLMPYDADAPEGIPRWLAELEREECICCYRDGGASYLQVQHWEKYQKIDRPSPSKIPKSGREVSGAPDLFADAPKKDPSGLATASAQAGRVDGTPLTPKAAPLTQPAAVAGCALPAGGTGIRTESEPTPEQAACLATWRAYREAYGRRYGTAPVRNARVNSQILNFVRRLGHVASPSVAGFFVRHESPAYLRGAHAVGQMLADAEKLHTEWATGRSLPDPGTPLPRHTRENSRVIAATTRLADFLDDQGTPRQNIGDSHAKSLRIARLVD